MYTVIYNYKGKYLKLNYRCLLGITAIIAFKRTHKHCKVVGLVKYFKRNIEK